MAAEALGFVPTTDADSRSQSRHAARLQFGTTCPQETQETKMHTPRTQPSPADVAMEVTSLSAGLGIVTIPLFPFALPGLLLVVGPLVPVALAAVLLAMPVVVPVWLVRTIRT